MRTAHWTGLAHAAMSAVLAKHPTDTIARRAALIDAYPFGARKGYPWKIWLRELRRLKQRKEVS
jgi:hypothetical protein